jgi:hypothetical protein
VNKNNQYLPKEKRNAMYVSRIDCLKAALAWHLQRLRVEHPNKRVVLVEFNSSITLIGDGTDIPKVITGDILDNKDKLFEIGTNYETAKLQPISASIDNLNKKLQSIEEGGSTALGPAMTVCVGIASTSSQSSIILCTDGLSNVGVGSLDTENKKEQTEFYRNLGHLAKSKKVIISVIGIQGSDSVALPIVGSLGDLTGGTVNINHPLELLTEIVRISQRPVVASSVSLRRFCPPGFVWSLLNGKELAVLEEDIGNATIDTDICCEFKFLIEGKSDPLKNVPFQVQIQFVRPDRYKCLRILTTTRPVTRQREEANKNVDVAIIGLHTIQLCGSLASANNVEGMREAHKRLFFCKKFLEDITENNNASAKEEFANFMKFAVPLDNILMSKKKG